MASWSATGLISPAEDRRGRSVGAAARHARHVGRRLLCHVLWGTSSINLFKVPSSSSHNYVIAQLHIRPQVDMAVVLMASPRSITKLPRPRQADVAILQHQGTTKGSRYFRHRAHTSAVHDLVIPFHGRSSHARRPVSACWRSLTRDPRCSTTCMKHTDPSTCRRQKEASVTCKGPLRQCKFPTTPVLRPPLNLQDRRIELTAGGLSRLRSS